MTGFSLNAEETTILERVQDTLSRLDLNEDQAEQFRPLIREHFKTQIDVLKNHDLSKGEESSLEDMQKLISELNGNTTSFEEQVSEILSESQMATFKEIDQEAREELRRSVLDKRFQQMAETLELSDEQFKSVKPTLEDHLESQLKVLEKHGVELGTQTKLGWRKLLKLRREINSVNSKTNRKLSKVLSRKQMKQYKAMQKEQSKTVRAQLQ